MPTHRVPENGLRAWATPDPTGPVISTLEPRAELVVMERSGDWAHVRAESGWTAWVDGRLLVANEETSAIPPLPPARPLAPSPPTTSTDRSRVGGGVALKPTWLALASAALVIIGAALPWARIVNSSVSGGQVTRAPAFDIPASLLVVGHHYHAAGLPIGVLIVALVLGPLAWRRGRLTRGWVATSGLAVASVAVLFAIRINSIKSLTDAYTGNDLGTRSFSYWFQPGWYMTLATGLLTAVVALLPWRLLERTRPAVARL